MLSVKKEVDNSFHVCCTKLQLVPQKRSKRQKKQLNMHTERHNYVLHLACVSSKIHISLTKKRKTKKGTINLFNTTSQGVCHFLGSHQFWMTSVSAEVSIPNS